MAKGKKTQTTTSSSRQTTQTNLPSYINAASRGAVDRATAIADRPYEAYSGTRIAGLSQNEQMGINMARDNVGAYGADYDAARQQLGGIGSITDRGALDGYMSPYVEAVINPQLRRANEAFESERARRQAEAGMTGAFGGRRDIYEAEAASRHELGMSEIEGAGRAAAFDRATQLHGQEMDRKLRTAGAYESLGTSTATQRRADLRDLMSTGMTERTRDQADLDFKYLEHLESRDWDVNNLSSLVDTLQRVPYEQGQTTTGSSESTTVSKESGSALKTIAGIGAIAAGAVMTGGASLAAGGTFWGGVGKSLLGVGTQALGSGGEA